MATARSDVRSRVRGLSWIAVSLLGVLLLGVPLYDVVDDVTNIGWSPVTTLAENSLFLLLALGLVAADVWLARSGWETRYVTTVVQWTLGFATLVTLWYAVVVALQLWAMDALKPWVLVGDGILFGAVTAFAVGLNDARTKRSRADLEESEQRHRSLTNDVLDTSGVATFVVDDDLDVVWANEAAVDYFGLDRETVVGRDKRRLDEAALSQAVEDSTAFRDRLAEAYGRNQSVEEFECHVLPGDGREERWLEHWSKPVETGLYEGGRIEHYTDVTSLTEHQRELERRERKLREMYDLISDSAQTFEEKVDGVVQIGRDLFGAEYGSFARIDQEADEYHLEVVQSEEADIEAGDVVPFSQTHCEQMVERDCTLQFEARPFDVEERDYGTDDGFEMYVGTPVYENDTLYGALCFLDREEADPFDDWQLTMVELMGNWMGYELNRKHLLEERQQEHRRKEAKFEEFVDSVVRYAIFTLDTEGLVTSWNSGAERVKGYTESEIVGEHFSVFYPEQKVDEGLPEQLLAEAAETGQASHEGWRLRKDGTRFWADVTIAARYDEHGDHVGYTKVTRDMTERREYEQALEHERERLEFINRVVRHNILNGLNLVNARTQLLSEQFADDTEARQHLDVVRDRVDDLADLIDTMRTFMDAVVSEGGHDTNPVEIRDVLERKVSLARDTNADAVYDFHDLPADTTRVNGDELVGEVFENVLSNAVLHNDEETPRVEVWTSESAVRVDESVDRSRADAPAERRAGDEARTHPALTVHIADNGPGIPDEEKEAVLEKGVSGLSEPGNGFGLYLVKEMMRAYGGTVAIRDNDPEGTVFDLTFPLVDADGEPV